MCEGWCVRMGWWGGGEEGKVMMCERHVCGWDGGEKGKVMMCEGGV